MTETTPPSSSSFYEILDRPFVIDRLLDLCTPLSIFRLKMTCRAADESVRGYILRTFDINKHIRHFFDDPIAFRVLLARTSAAVSGSNALQFFNRMLYGTSDLDLYVAGPQNALEVFAWLTTNEYGFCPTRKQMTEEGLRAGETFTDVSSQETVNRLCSMTLKDGETDIGRPRHGTVDHDNPYPRQVFNFFRTVFLATGEPDRECQVQVICGVDCAVDAVLHFHSSERL